jgi:nucleoside-diphosphate-sugar epimerase
LKYLVLGGSGFIGNSLVIYLKKLGHKVTNLDIVQDSKNDLRKMKIENIEDFDGCFFLAWDVGGSKYLNKKENWNSQYQNNISLINNVIPQLEKNKIPFLFVSSQLAGVDNSPYSLTKQLAENYCRTIENCVVARQWNAYGVIEKADIKSHVVSDLVLSALSTNKIQLLTTGEEQRKFIHIQDICNAYYIMLTKHTGNIYDVSSGGYISILNLAEIISKYTGADIKPGLAKGTEPIVTEYPTVPEWQPKISIDEGIKNLIQKINEKQD